MTTVSRRNREQLTFLAPSEAALVELVRQNLRLLSELRSTYQTASREADCRTVRSPDDVAALLSPEMELLMQEQLRVVLLDTRNRVLDVLMIYQGNVNSTMVRMAEVFREAIVVCAPNIVLVHNHPRATRRRPWRTRRSPGRRWRPAGYLESKCSITS
jgi:DNA repair protein RadC